MKKISFIAALLSFAHSAHAQKAEVISASELQRRIAGESDKIQIINFWATWCGPCVKELPLFEKITSEGRPDVKVTLVSLDLDLDPDAQKVYKFIDRKNIQSEVLLLSEPDPNSWINKIAPEWSGALPATLIINAKTGKRKFIGRSLHQGELDEYLNEIQ
jgi:thiol-disulfide isomerase/thioredoxin